MDYDSISQRVCDQVEAILARPPYSNMEEEKRLETRTQLITSLYSTAIQQEEAKNIKTPLPPPPQRATVEINDLTDALNNSVVPSVNRNSKQVQLNSILSGLPLRIQKEIKTSLGETLGGTDSLPVQQDLTEFFEKAERVIEGISPDFGVYDLQRRHIKVIAPIILGRATWDEVRDADYDSWNEFKAQLMKLYGLSRQQIEEAFFDMRMAKSETSHDFILRVEQKRRKYGFSEQECYRAFKSTLPISYWEKLDEAREFAVLCDEDAEIQVNWETLVRRARHANKNVKLGAAGMGKVVAGFEPAGVQIPQRGIAIAVPPVPRLREESWNGTFAFKQVDCQLCIETGKDNAHTHEIKDCWANPYSERYRKSAYEARLLECYRRNLPIPDVMKVYQDKAENYPAQKQADGINVVQDNPQPPASHGRISESQARQFHSDLQAQLMNPNNDLHQAIAQALEDNFGMDSQQTPDHVPDPGPTCMFTHCDTDVSDEDSVASLSGRSQNLCAITKATREIQLETLKGHLRELSKFSEAELIAALEDDQGNNTAIAASSAVGDVAMSVGDKSEYSSEGEDEKESDSEDDVDEEATMAKIIRDLKQKALAKKKAKDQKMKNKKTKGQTTGQRLDKIKYMLPFLEAIMIKRNLRGLLLNYATDYAFQNDETVKVRKGTKVKEVSERRLLAEREVYKTAGIDEESQVINKLKNLKLQKNIKVSRDRHQLAKEYADSIGDILLGLVADAQSKDQEFAGAMVSRDHIAAQPNNQWRYPQWMKNRVEVNALGKIKLSENHYMGTIVLGGILMHAMLDTCGAKSMIDRKSAEELGFDIEVATKERHFGSFYGPGGRVVYYYGRIKGPIEVWLDTDVKLLAPEIKVVEHFEPLMLLGTDILAEGSTRWNFCYIGLHPVSREGNLVVVDKKGNTKEIALTSWPLNGKNTKLKIEEVSGNAIEAPVDNKLKAMLQKAKQSKENKQNEAKARKEKLSNKETGAKAALLSLLREQGQCL